MSLIQLVKPQVTQTTFQGRSIQEKSPAIADVASKPVAGEMAQSLPAVPASLQQVYFGAARRSGNTNLTAAREIVRSAITTEQFDQENEVLSWDEYLTKVIDKPAIARDSYQRIFDMIEGQGKKEAFTDNGDPMFTAAGDRIYSYQFFTGQIAGMEQPLHQIVQSLKAAAKGGEARNRYFRLDGPVGTAKSTIVGIMKRGLEAYSKTDEGSLYALGWKDLPAEVATSKDLQLEARPKRDKEGKIVTGANGQPVEEYFYIEPMHDDPLRVVPEEIIVRDKTTGKENVVKPRAQLMDLLNGQGKLPYKLQMRGGLSPASGLIREKLMEHYSDQIKKGKIKLAPGETLMDKVLSHVEARRMVFDETKRVGIGNYLPKDAKNQDSTELNGDIDYSKLPMYGNPNHPLVQAYRGEFNVANRGLMDFEEMLKLQREFLYDILTASQERSVKPKNGTLLPIDMLIVGKTNMEELDEKLQDDKMKAFFNRARSFRVPYLLEPGKEVKIYQKSFMERAQNEGITVAPHTLNVAAEWAVITRLDPEITKSESIRDGKGMYGVSPRFLQNVFDDVLVHSQSEGTKSVSPFTVIRVIAEHLNKDDFQDRKNLERYFQALGVAAQRLTAQIKADVYGTFQKDADLQRSYFAKYVKNLQRWAKDPATADEQFLSRVEKKMKAPVANSAVREYRDNLLTKLNALDDMPITLDLLDEDPNLRQSLAEIMFEDMKNQLDGAPVDKVIQNLKKLQPADSPVQYTDATAREAIEHLTTPGGIL